MALVPVETPWGHAIPPYAGHQDKHAITVHLPCWSTILDMISLEPKLIHNLKNMYPRLLPLPVHFQLAGTIIGLWGDDPSRPAVPFYCREAVEKCKEYVTAATREENRLLPDEVREYATIARGHPVYAVSVPKGKEYPLMEFWTVSGFGVSPRYSEFLLEEPSSFQQAEISTSIESHIGDPSAAAYVEVRERLASMMDRAPRFTKGRIPTRPEDVFLYPTGMATAYRINANLKALGNNSAALFNVAYMSVEMSLAAFNSHFRFFGRGVEYDELEEYLQEERQQGRAVGAVWTEVPSNPNLVTADVPRLRELADKYDFILVVDNTIATDANVDLFGPGGADIIMSSLSKTFSGYADVMAGSVVLNPSSKRYDTLRKQFESSYRNELFPDDAEILASNSRDFLHRQAIHNDNTLTLVNHLHERSHDPKSAIAKVQYTTLSDTGKNYEKILRPATEEFTPGYGCLFSVELRTNALTIAWYDAISRYVHAGPSFGAHATIVLAYCQFAHSTHLDAVEPYGLNEKQVRVGVGLEDINVLKAAFDEAERIALAMCDEINPKL